MKKSKLLAKLYVGAGLASMAGLAFADVDSDIAAAFSDAAGKVSTYGGGLVTLATVGVAFAIGIKYLKKARGAA